MDKRTLQRHRSLLVTCGTGYIIFGILEVIQAISLLLYGDMSSLVLQNDVIPQKTMYIILVCMLITLSLLFFFIRLYIGLRAIREGYGREVKHGYLVLCFISAAIAAPLTVVSLIKIPAAESILDQIGNVLYGVSTVAILLQIIRSSIFVGKYAKSSESNL